MAVVVLSLLTDWTTRGLTRKLISRHTSIVVHKAPVSNTELDTLGNVASRLECWLALKRSSAMAILVRGRIFCRTHLAVLSLLQQCQLVLSEL
ncbi:hypothetical protein BC567DRAFT_232375 [Phyllosticta citribraziliensis]